MRHWQAMSSEVARTASATGLRMAGAAASFVLALVLSARLGAADAGIFYTSINWATAIAVVALWGVPMVIQHEIPPLLAGFRAPLAPTFVGHMLLGAIARAAMLLAPLATVGVLAGSDTLRSAVEIVPLFTIALALLGLMLRFAGAAAKAWGAIPLAMASEFLLAPLLMLAAIMIVPDGVSGSVGRAMLAYAIATALSLVLLLAPALVRMRRLRPARSEMPGNWKRRQTVFGQIAVGQFLIAFGAMTVLPFALDASELGILNLIFRIAGLLVLANATIASIAIPRLSAAQASGGYAACRPILRAVHALMALTALAALALAVVAGRPVMGLAGEEFARWSWLLLPAVAGFCGAMLFGPVGSELTLLGEERAMRDIVLPLALVGVAASLLAGWSGGIAWAAIVPGAFALLTQVLQRRALLRYRPGSVHPR